MGRQSRQERLINLFVALIDTSRPLTRHDIQKRVTGYSQEDNAFRRAFERDKEALRAMGIPITVEALDPLHPEDGEGYSIPPDKYYLPDPGLTKDELEALALGASAVKLRSQSSARALWKLSVYGHGDEKIPRGTSDNDLALADVQLNDDARLAQVFNARAQKRLVSFTYKAQRREVETYRLSFRGGHWYVFGFDRTRSSERTYRLDRIESDIEVSDPDAYSIPQSHAEFGKWLPSWQMGEDDPVRAVVRFDADYATLVRERNQAELPIEILETNDDGSTLAAFEVRNRQAFRAYLLGFLDHAEILEPSQLRDEMVAYLRELTGAS